MEVIVSSVLALWQTRAKHPIYNFIYHTVALDYWH